MHLQLHLSPDFPAASKARCLPLCNQHVKLSTSRCFATHITSSTPSTRAFDLQSWHQLTATATCVVCLLAQPCLAEELSIAFPASGNPEIREAQKTLVESWAYVDNLYVEPNDHTEWAKALQDALAASFKAPDAQGVRDINLKLLAQLGDPYTRLLQADEQDALAAEEEGRIVATGLGLQQVTLAPVSGTNILQAFDRQQPPTRQQLLLVSFVVEGSPAAAAGVSEGDVVLTVAGVDVAGKDLRDVYRLLSKEGDVTLARQPVLPTDTREGSGSSGSSCQSDGLSDGAGLCGAESASSSDAGVTAVSAGRSTADVLQDVEQYTVRLKPAPLEFEPVQYGIIDLDRAGSSATVNSATAFVTDTNAQEAGGSTGSRRVGYMKLLTFSATAPQAVAEALQDLQQEGSQQPSGLAGLIVDLRDNPGGIVEAGVDIAQDFLRAGQVLCVVVDKTGQEERVVFPEAHTRTELPLAVLVNHSTASTSELLAGALHDNLGAPLIGSTTYGKGRTQRVIPLADGKSTLLVSTLKYFTPQHKVIDNVGLQPNTVCVPDEVLGQQWLGGKVGKDKDSAGSLLDDPCIRLAAQELSDQSRAVA